VHLIDDNFCQPSPLENAQGDAGHLMTLHISMTIKPSCKEKFLYCSSVDLFNLCGEGVIAIIFGNGVKE
jgi:hypothetical protein